MSTAQQPACRFGDKKRQDQELLRCGAATWRGRLRRDLSGRHPMSTALLAIAPRISYRALFVVSFAAAYPLWHADFPAVSVEHVDVVPTTPQSTPIPLPESVSVPTVQSVRLPQARLGHCRG
jgi:hypothetical protein